MIHYFISMTEILINIRVGSLYINHLSRTSMATDLGVYNTNQAQFKWTV